MATMPNLGLKDKALLALVAFVLILMASLWFQHMMAIKKDKKIVALNGTVAGYKFAAAQEVNVHIFQDKLKVQVNAAQAAIAKTDPKCADPQPLIDAWKSGINSVRAPSGSSDSAVSQGTMQ